MMNNPDAESLLLILGDVDEIDGQFLFIDLDEEIADYLNHNVSAPHRHAYYEIIWIRQGSASHLLDGELLDLPMNTVLVIPKGHIHRFAPTPDCRGSVIRFREEFLLNSSLLIFSQFAGHTALQLTVEQVSYMESYLELIHSESRRQSDPYNLQALRFLLAAFIARLEELRLLESRVMPQDFSRTQGIWNRFSTMIEQRFKTEHDVSYYASGLGVSPRRLGGIVRMYTGKHVSEIIDERLIIEAKRMILFSDSTIKEIAFSLGFEEHSYFSKVFKKLTGKSPVEFRQNNHLA
ncbi:MAG: helix-turn-helix domain-containing protein [Chlorobiaceae bacterium]|nr:helix-turn-helix domain-containing protein [Chlorobiaceae bacterium]